MIRSLQSPSVTLLIDIASAIPASVQTSVSVQAWGWLKQLYPAQIADIERGENCCCLCLCDTSSGVMLDLRLELTCARLQFCSAVMTLSVGAEHEALAFLEWNGCLDWPGAEACFAYHPARREIFVRGSAALAQFGGCESLHAFLQDALDRMVQVKAQCMAAAIADSHAGGWIH